MHLGETWPQGAGAWHHTVACGQDGREGRDLAGKRQSHAAALGGEGVLAENKAGNADWELRNPQAQERCSP